MSASAAGGRELVGERIAAQARKIIPKGQSRSSGFPNLCLFVKFAKDAYAVIDKELRISIPPTLNRPEVMKLRGNFVSGHSITAQCGAMRKILLISGSSAHRTQKTIMDKNVYCVLDLPYRSA